MLPLFESLSAPTRYFQLVLRRFGVTQQLREAILEGVGLNSEQVEAPGLEISLLQQIRQAENMDRLFGEGWLLDAPELWRPSAHAALGVAMVNAPTVGRALQVLAMHLQAVMPGHGVRLAREGEMNVLRFAARAPTIDSWERRLAELTLLGAASSLGWPLGEAAKELTFEYQWPEPAYGPRLAETLGGEVSWGAGGNAIKIPLHRLDLRSPFTDPPLFEQALKRLGEAAGDRRMPDSLRGQIERLLARSKGGRLSSQAAAQAIGISQRTLERRLAGEAVHFRDLVDAELKARAQRMLTANVLTRTEIAEQLGFADSSGFSRALRRWSRMDV